MRSWLRTPHLIVSLLLSAACSSPSPTTAVDGGTETEIDTSVAPLEPPGRTRDHEASAATRPLTQHVRVQRGSGGIGFSDIGSAFVGPQIPFGMIRPGPDTTGSATAAPQGFTHTSGYAATDTFVRAFGQVHLHGVGITDYGAIGLLPNNTNVLHTPLPIDKTSERFAPGVYSVSVQDGSPIAVQIGATARTAYYEIESSNASVYLHLLLEHAVPDVRIDARSIVMDESTQSLRGSVTIQGAYSRRGGGVTVHFAARTRDAWRSWGTEAGANETASSSRAYIETAGHTVVAIAISYVDQEGALRNLEEDIERFGFSLTAVRQDADTQWERQLEHVLVHGPSDFDVRNFYTSLYQASLMPSLASDQDGRYRGLDGAIHTATDHLRYTDFSLWDTYRTLHPLWHLLDVPRARDFARSLIDMAEERGSFPRWPIGTVESGGMVGDPAAIVLADAYKKNVPFDRERALNLFDRGARREHAESYETRGFVATEDRNWSASVTMEYAYADFALAALGANNVAQSRYQNLYDATQGFFRGRNRDGSFVTTSATAWSSEYAEGNAWQYLFFAPYDFAGLSERLGGASALRARLDTFFLETAREDQTRSEILRRALYSEWYWAGNEPDIHTMWLYSDLNAQSETIRLTHWALRTKYSLEPNGLPGNDDSGTLSAWYVFAALGIYPIAGSDEYWLGSPIFERADFAVTNADLSASRFSFAHNNPDARAVTVQNAVAETLQGRVRHIALMQGLRWSTH